MQNRGSLGLATMGNGLTLINDQSAANSMVALALVSRYGLRDGTAREAGQLRLLGETFFRGTATGMGTETLLERLEALGATYETRIDMESTQVLMLAPAERASELLNLMGELVCKPAADGAELKKRKALFMREIRATEDSPSSWVDSHFFEGSWASGSSLSRPLFGSMAGLGGATPEQLLALHGTVFDPSRMALVISGGGGLKERDVEEVFASLSSGTARIVRAPARWPASPTSTVRIRSTEDGESPMVTLCASTPMPPLRNAAGALDIRKARAFDVLQAALSAGMSGRLFYHVREKRGLVYSISCSQNILSDTGLFTMDTWMAPANGPAALQIAYDQIRALATGDPATGGLDARELSKAKAQACARVARRTATALRRGIAFADQWAVGGAVTTPGVRMAQLASVTGEEVRDAARALVANLEMTRLVFVAPSDITPALRSAICGKPQRQVA